MRKHPIYLDYNATTPCDPRVVESMIPYLSMQFGNAASSDHWYGWQAKDAVENARDSVATLIGAHGKNIIFTSGATESVNLALKGLAEGSPAAKNHIITSKTEHSAVLETCAWLETKGYRITYLDVDAQGQISLDMLEAAIGSATICIAIMYANNETGAIHPVSSIGAIAKKYRVPFFCDATQAVGKIPVNVDEAGIDLMAFSAHKMYGPKGVGALFIRHDVPVPIISQLHGGGHERGLRSGTLNTPGIVGFGTAADLCRNEMLMDAERLCTLRDQLEQGLLLHLPGIVINGGKQRLPHVSNFLVPHSNTEQLLLSLAQHVAMSRGSACSGLVRHPSHVLTAMGLSDDEAFRALRISLGRFTQTSDIGETVERITQAIMSANYERAVV